MKTKMKLLLYAAPFALICASVYFAYDIGWKGWVVFSCMFCGWWIENAIKRLTGE